LKKILRAIMGVENYLTKIKEKRIFKINLMLLQIIKYFSQREHETRWKSRIKLFQEMIIYSRKDSNRSKQSALFCTPHNNILTRFSYEASGMGLFVHFEKINRKLNKKKKRPRINIYLERWWKKNLTHFPLP